MWRCRLFFRELERQIRSLQAACQRGEKERQTSGEWVGVETALEGRGSRFVCDLSKDLRANFWLMRGIKVPLRIVSHSSGICLPTHTSPSFSPFFSALMFVSCRLKHWPSLGHVSLLQNSPLLTRSDLHIKRSEGKWALTRAKCKTVSRPHWFSGRVRAVTGRKWRASLSFRWQMRAKKKRVSSPPGPLLSPPSP